MSRSRKESDGSIRRSGRSQYVAFSFYSIDFSRNPKSSSQKTWQSGMLAVPGRIWTPLWSVRGGTTQSWNSDARRLYLAQRKRDGKVLIMSKSKVSGKWFQGALLSEWEYGYAIGQSGVTGMRRHGQYLPWSHWSREWRRGKASQRIQRYQW